MPNRRSGVLCRKILQVGYLVGVLIFATCVFLSISGAYGAPERDFWPLVVELTASRDARSGRLKSVGKLVVLWYLTLPQTSDPKAASNRVGVPEGSGLGMACARRKWAPNDTT